MCPLLFLIIVIAFQKKRLRNYIKMLPNRSFSFKMLSSACIADVDAGAGVGAVELELELVEG
jgi:hypothetical protein